MGSGARSSGEVARAPLAFNVGPNFDPTTAFWKSNNQRVHLRFVDDRWVSPDHVSLEWSAWCTPSVHRPRARSPSIGVTPPNRGRSDVLTDGRSWRSRGIDYDDVLYHYFSYPSN